MLGVLLAVVTGIEHLLHTPTHMFQAFILSLQICGRAQAQMLGNYRETAFPDRLAIRIASAPLGATYLECGSLR